MDVDKLAHGLALNRISFGAGLILRPRLYARSWVGSDAAAAIAVAYVRSASKADAS